MSWIKEALPHRVWSSFTDFFHRWWKAAALPLAKTGLRPGRALLRRFMLWVPVLVLLAAMIGGIGFYFFTGWRSGDLARKAADNAREGNLAMARLQIMSANNLRPDNSMAIGARVASREFGAFDHASLPGFGQRSGAKVAIAGPVSAPLYTDA